MKVSIIGTGKIGTDLLNKLEKLPNVEIVAFVGRKDIKRRESKYVSSSIQFFIDNPKCCDVVFDCTDACTALKNNIIFSSQSIKVIDLTPSKQGYICVPNVNCDEILNEQNISMITCGGQISIPVLYNLSTKIHISYAEVVTHISSDSAGMATRENIDDYIHTTESAITKLTGIEKSKVILNISPHAHDMKTTIIVKFTRDDSDPVNVILSSGNDMKTYIPGYDMENPIYIKDDVISVTSFIRNSELPGNLDIINRAAIQILKKLMS